MIFSVAPRWGAKYLLLFPMVRHICRTTGNEIQKHFHPNGVTQKNMTITKAAEKTFLSSLHENFVTINSFYFFP